MLSLDNDRSFAMIRSRNRGWIWPWRPSRARRRKRSTRISCKKRMTCRRYTTTRRCRKCFSIFRYCFVITVRNCVRVFCYALLYFIRILHNINYLKKYSSLLYKECFKNTVYYSQKRFEKVIIYLTSLKIIDFLIMRHNFFNDELFITVLTTQSSHKSANQFSFKFK